MEKYSLETPPYYVFLAPPIFLIVSIIGFLQSSLDIIMIGISILGFLFLMGVVGHYFYKANKKYKIITMLRNRGEYRNVVIQTLDERITGGRRSRTYYIYVCRDISTDNTYDSDEIDIENSTFNIGDVVHLYVSSEFPDIYWVDLNYVESGSGKNKLSLEEQKIGEETVKIMKNQAINDRSSNKLYGLILIGILLFMSLCYLSSSLFFYINNKETIGIITKIEPYNSYCGSKNKYECTTYSTTIYLDKIDFSSPFSIKIDSYSAKGHNQPIPLSKYQVGQSIELFVNPNQVLMPDGAYNGVEIKELLLRRILIFSIISIIFTGVFIFFIKSSKKNSSINLQNAN